MPDNKAESGASDEEILRVARERFALAVEAEADLRKEAIDDMRFSAGEQWDPEIKNARTIDRRPCLTINRLPNTIHQITNDQRQNRPSIKVSPIDDEGDLETAKIYQGIIRHIEYSSDADTAYDTAFDSAVRCGFGFFRITTEYADPMAFDQDIRFKRIRNRHSAYIDPSYQKPDGSDAEWGFVFENLTRDEYKIQYPNSKLASIGDWEALGDQMPGWMGKNFCRIAEYFYTVYEEIEISQLSNGNVVESKSLENIGELPDGIKVTGTRKSMVPKIKWAKICGDEILERTDWLGRWIPIIPVLGEELDIDGERKLSGIVRQAKDPQRMYNYWASAETEAIALAPRAPIIGAEGQFEGHEDQWATSNTRNHAFLQYVPVSLQGQLAPPPQRQVYEPAVQAITNARQLASQDIKDTTGIYDASLGNRSNEQSGVAIYRRNAQAQTSNFHFHDNLSKSIRHAGRILVDLIPKVYDTARAVRILHPDGQEEVVRINQEFQYKGKPTTFSLGVGKYDVAVNSGPSYETKRQEASASMADLIKSYPNLMQSVGDLLVKNLDWPGAEEIAERLRKLLPPNLLDDKNKQPIPPQAQAQIQHMSQMVDQLTQHLQAKTQIVEQKTLELESRERIEMAKLQADLQITLAQLGSKESMALLEHQVTEISERLKMLHANIPIDQEAAGPTQETAQPQMNEAPAGGESAGGQEYQ